MANEQDVSGQSNVSSEDLWVLDNYILIKDYLDRTISRIAARCVRSNNIAIEEYPFYGYILDVLEELCDSGDYITSHPSLYPYVEKKIAGGLPELQKRLAEFKLELQNNSSPDMIREDEKDIEKAKAILGDIDNSLFDPTKGAGMSMDAVIDKLTQGMQNLAEEEE